MTEDAHDLERIEPPAISGEHLLVAHTAGLVKSNLAARLTLEALESAEPGTLRPHKVGATLRLQQDIWSTMIGKGRKHG